MQDGIYQVDVLKTDCRGVSVPVAMNDVGIELVRLE
jgi:hypothetical protein